MLCGGQSGVQRSPCPGTSYISKQSTVGNKVQEDYSQKLSLATSRENGIAVSTGKLRSKSTLIRGGVLVEGLDHPHSGSYNG